MWHREAGWVYSVLDCHDKGGAVPVAEALNGHLINTATLTFSCQLNF